MSTAALALVVACVSAFFTAWAVHFANFRRGRRHLTVRAEPLYALQRSYEISFFAFNDGIQDEAIDAIGIRDRWELRSRLFPMEKFVLGRGETHRWNGDGAWFRDRWPEGRLSLRPQVVWQTVDGKRFKGRAGRDILLPPMEKAFREAQREMERRK